MSPRGAQQPLLRDCRLGARIPEAILLCMATGVVACFA
jgi:hypothetical protein